MIVVSSKYVSLEWRRNYSVDSNSQTVLSNTLFTNPAHPGSSSHRKAHSPRERTSRVFRTAVRAGMVQVREKAARLFIGW